MEEEKVRLYVGGLGREVSASDIQERFAPLGKVQSIVLPSAKAGPGHRGFAYVDFVPATDASLRKLFSAYNGCKWRGGLLRIEKAKEHFTDRLHREWAVEAASITVAAMPANQSEIAHPSFLATGGQKQVNGGNRREMEDDGLKIFFPSLRKLRTVPLTGLGKHKRSFQRVESSPLQQLLSCACEESLRSGSCNCSKISSDSCSSKVEMGSDSDEISRAIHNERARQLELLSRLFPSDSTSTSLENEVVVELDGNDVKIIGEHDNQVGSAEEPSSNPTPVPIDGEMGKAEQPKHLVQSSETQIVVGKQQSEPSNWKMDEEIGIEDDSISASVAKERAKQLELMHRLFPADAPSISLRREAEQEAVQPEIGKIKIKRKRKREVESSPEKAEPIVNSTRSRITDHADHFQSTAVGTVYSWPTISRTGTGTAHKAAEPIDQSLQRTETEQQSDDPSMVRMDPDHSSRENTAMNLDGGDDSLPLATTEEQEGQMLKSRPAVLSDDDLEEDSEMILNLGDDFVPLAIAEEQERHVLKSIPIILADNLSEEDSELILKEGGESLSLSIAEEKERDGVKSLSARADELLEKDSDMSSHPGDHSLTPASAEKQEWHAPNSTREVNLEDSVEGLEMTLNLGDDSMPLSTAEQHERQVLISMSPLDNQSTRNLGKRVSRNYKRGVNKAEGVEDSEDKEDVLDHKDDSLNRQKQSESTPNPQSNERSGEALLQRSEDKSGMIQQRDEPSKWAALAEMCQFRDAEVVTHTKGSGAESKSMQVGKSSRDEDKPRKSASPIHVDDSKGSSQHDADVETGRGQPLDEPSGTGQKLTRAAWKSLVGETGRVVFSLSQLTGSSLPQLPPPTQQSQTVDDTCFQMEPVMSPKTPIHNRPKSKLAVGPTEKKTVDTRSPAQPNANAAELFSTPMTSAVSSGDFCTFMKSENAEEEWLATKSELRSDYRAKHKHAARSMKKLWGKHT